MYNRTTDSRSASRARISWAESSAQLTGSGALEASPRLASLGPDTRHSCFPPLFPPSASRPRPPAPLPASRCRSPWPPAWPQAVFLTPRTWVPETPFCSEGLSSLREEPGASLGVLRNERAPACLGQHFLFRRGRDPAALSQRFSSPAGVGVPSVQAAPTGPLLCCFGLHWGEM